MFIREINKIFVSTLQRRALNVRQQRTHAMQGLPGNRVSEDASVCAVACFVLPYISFLSSLSPQTSDS